MNYFIIRLIFPILLLIVGIIIYQKASKKNIKSSKRLLIEFFIFNSFAIFIILMSRLDIEEKILQFNNPTLAYKYSYPSIKIINTIDKDDYKVFFYLASPEIKYQIVQKNSNNNWNYIYPKDMSKINTYTGNYSINIYEKDGLNFIAVTNHNALENINNVNIKDNKNSIFEKYDERHHDEFFDITYTVYYAFIDSFDDYKLYINNLLIYEK